MKFSRPFFPACILAFSALAAAPFRSPLQAQAPALPVGKNIVSNGGFEQAFTTDNRWDGVDSAGNLAGFPGQIMALTESGGFAELAMPTSVAAADMNNDGLTDIVAADATGYLRIYFNAGTPAEPKFEGGDLVPVFTSRTKVLKLRRFAAPKVALADFGRSGKYDLILGTYGGDILLIPNAGSAGAPDFRQPAPLERAKIEFTSLPEGWGNLLAPHAIDLNRDGRLDLLVGEGSYSANAVYFAANQSAGGAPRFNDENRHYLCYGDGREQLHPTTADYNDDGVPDILIGDRKGAVAVHLGKKDWKPGTTLEEAARISFGSSAQLGSAISPAAADMNGDGLFDLLIGKSNGRVALATNIGTKGSPKFGPPTDIKGVNQGATSYKTPSSLSIDTQQDQGNFLAVAQSVDATEDPLAVPPEGKRALKLSFLKPANKLVPMRHAFISAESGGGPSSYNTGQIKFDMTVARPPKPGTPLMVRMKYFGSSFKGSWRLTYEGSIIRSLTQRQITDRGGVENQKADREILEEGSAINPNSSWQTVERRITLQFKKIKELNSPEEVQGASKPQYKLQFTFDIELDPDKGVFYLDDVQLVPEA